MDTTIYDASTPLVRFSIPQTSLASFPITLRTHFYMMLHQVSPSPTGLTPVCFPSAIRRPPISAW